jgi:drug/metabolite transporter (DMT)-like permease
MTAVVLALGSAALFGLMTVRIRIALGGGADAALASLATVLPALGVVLVAAIVRGDPHGAWPFLLTGLLGPGLSQILFTLAIADIGASRTSVAVGCAPLASVVIAVVFFGESLTAPLFVGAVSIVSGGVLLALERDRPEHLRTRGLAFAAAAALVFATRDNIVRALHAHANPETAAAATLLAGAFAAALWARRVPSRSVLAAFALPGVLFGLSYICLFEAYWRAPVTVVSPLVATESLFGVLFAALLLKRTELVGAKLVVGALLVVLGGVLIGFYR